MLRSILPTKKVKKKKKERKKTSFVLYKLIIISSHIRDKERGCLYTAWEGHRLYWFNTKHLPAFFLLFNAGYH